MEVDYISRLISTNIQLKRKQPSIFVLYILHLIINNISINININNELATVANLRLKKHPTHILDLRPTYLLQCSA